uniref:C2H2-type domain-containing protein n=1 Tax=viral metagenome TaxID=1070528 RepID=A0A6C0JCK6_9ZZZZ|tara:strand:- start:3126 stop:4115 length:990 start_codon:yes stop_codon:yes gene_type:complete
MKNDNKKPQKTPKNGVLKKIKYSCIYCDFLSSNKKDFSRHILTAKHKKFVKMGKKHTGIEFVCNFCEKCYIYKSGISRHKKKCEMNPQNFCGKNGKVTLNPLSDEYLKKGTPVFEENAKLEEDVSLKDILMQQLKQQNETIELLKQSIETNTKMIPKIGNNNNNTISINVFLNEQCKNAMNLTDFINQVHISLEDLQYSKNNGFVEGVTNILAKQLNDLKPTERPIHCSDKKRLHFYVKEDDKWSKDSNNEKIDETIYNIKMKQTSKLTDWEKLHPNYVKDSKLLNEWQQILNSMTEESGQRDKIKDKLKRNIAEHIQIKQALTDVNEN